MKMKIWIGRISGITLYLAMPEIRSQFVLDRTERGAGGGWRGSEIQAVLAP